MTLEIRDRVNHWEIRVRDGLATRVATVAEFRRESRGAETLLEIVREAIENEIVDP